MNKLTTIASLPGSGSGCMSALPATEIEKKTDFLLFNINDYVSVKLTDKAKVWHKEAFLVWKAAICPKATLQYVPPEEDAQGWSKWQMWHLMEDFGPMVRICSEPPFATGIRIHGVKEGS